MQVPVRDEEASHEEERENTHRMFLGMAASQQDSERLSTIS
jgi:hypothetical protein